MEKDEKLLDHNYDGIQELDNQLPPWWLNLFYITIIWGLGYFAYYHVLDMGDLMEDEYKREMGYTVEEKGSFGFLNGYRTPYSMEPGGGAVNDQKSIDVPGADTGNEVTMEQTEILNFELITSAERLKNGAAVYTTNCVACHGANGEGGIGPNLTDNFWINGDGSFNTIVHVIQVGVPVKGMISWKPLLSETDLLDAASHVFNLRGTNPANAKEPQGEKYGD